MRENLKGHFLGEIIHYELKWHDWKKNSDSDKDRIKRLVQDAYELGLLVYADTHQWEPCEQEHEMGMVMDSSERNPGCDKDYFQENVEQGQEI